ncbi:tetratricopeptide repeat protein 32-like [Ylistrum balloti]|uniref:tetratricopeptide repeat protein 32-like n=1 Tax=Ylistrum balloti TaxID=509963 RepID=UPI0029058339|nr:tetratricopeptide repeat protein 32-like [Ylistrum balloti]
MEGDLRLFELAKSEESQGNHDKALELYSSFIDFTSRDNQSDNNDSLKQTLALAYNNRGYLRYLRVDFDEAVEDFTKGINLDPGLAVAYYNRGTIHYRLGRFDTAIADMKASLMKNPDFTEAKTGLEHCLADRQEKLDRPW